MGKRRISQSAVAEIGAERIQRLLDLAEEAVRDGRMDRACHYVELARRIGAKTRVPMPKDRPCCDECLAPLMPGVTYTVRVGRHMVRTTCGYCGAIRRMPYIREQ